MAKKFKRKGWVECTGPEGKPVWLNINDALCRVDAGWIMPNGNTAVIIGSASMQVQDSIDKILKGAPDV